MVVSVISNGMNIVGNAILIFVFHMGAVSYTHLFLEQVWKYHPSHGENKSLYARMVELLRDRGNEEQHQETKWMAVPPDKDVYLETVESAEDKEEKTYQFGSRQPLCGNNCL